jgi:hypothetical protein
MILRAPVHHITMVITLDHPSHGPDCLAYDPILSVWLNQTALIAPLYIDQLTRLLGLQGPGPPCFCQWHLPEMLSAPLFLYFIFNLFLIVPFMSFKFIYSCIMFISCLMLNNVKTLKICNVLYLSFLYVKKYKKKYIMCNLLLFFLVKKEGYRPNLLLFNPRERDALWPGVTV